MKLINVSIDERDLRPVDPSRECKFIIRFRFDHGRYGMSIDRGDSASKFATTLRDLAQLIDNEQKT